MRPLAKNPGPVKMIHEALNTLLGSNVNFEDTKVME
jgi:hypothetical protein